MTILNPPATKKGIYVLRGQNRIKVSGTFIEIISYDGDRVEVALSRGNPTLDQVWISTKWLIYDLCNLGVHCNKNREHLFIEWLQEEWLRATMKQTMHGRSVKKQKPTTTNTGRPTTKRYWCKRGYSSKAHALKAHKTLANRFRAYTCSKCNMWHVTSQKITDYHMLP